MLYLPLPLLRRFSLARLAYVVTGLAGWLLVGNPASALAQADSLQTIAHRLTSYQQRLPAEKLFLHLDRPSYVSGETLWFKVYAVAGSSHQPLPASKIAYVEVLSSGNKAVLQAQVALKQATGRGSFVLPATLPSGRYTVRAYTSWMQNFSPELYFHTTITVVNTSTPAGGITPTPAAAYDVQFFPEGGYLVAGIKSTLGVKITNSAGQGIAAEGTLLDKNGVSVGRFSTLRFGLGRVEFTPAQAGTAYKAVVQLPNRQTATYALPAVQEQGYVLHLTEGSAEQLRVTVRSRGAALENEQVFLLAHAGQKVALATAGQLVDGQAVFVVNKSQLAAGVAHLTLFNSRRQPVCERLYFSRPPTGLTLTVQTDKAQYARREKVTLQLQAASGPAASLSVAVYQLDSLTTTANPDIAGYLWLTSELKGPVEQPGYYLKTANQEVAAAADNLMLTQGWSRFRWDDVLAEKAPPVAFLPELNGHVVRGRVVNRSTGAPGAGVASYLSAPSRHIRLATAVSKADGSVQFEMGELYGRRQVVAQANSLRDSMYRVELQPPFSARFAAGGAGQLTLSESLAASLQRRYVQAQVQQRYAARPSSYTLPAVDSTAFYGRPSEQYRLDDYTRFKVMEEVMREYVPGVMVRIRKDGFHFRVLDDNSQSVTENPLVLLDGMPVFNINRIMAFDPLKVQKLDVVTTRYFIGGLVYDGVVSYTTYKGDLAGFPLDAHALLQEYEGLQGQREFYAPRYDTPQARKSRLPDFRNLLYWNPDASAAPLTFYTSDQVGRYLVVVQGLAENGQAGSATFTFEVKPAL
ncbi:hypothetical protein HER32_09135 [Hymenobacter sp. BT18]|uniref:hypothetical protein n=1 Tax=Hymenobacter sp. BT18 TaxID=2835648 RepID=UPI00143E646E|nr:hypothetical protein [Hymenobacter sp. BT18]QIX61335.1 hypothetical protein HER32_09135 [Hymenobacter sp. BT18]